MKIENNGLNRLSKNEAENANSVERSNQNGDASSLNKLGGKDQATLSDRGRILSKARVAMDDVADVRAERVAPLRAQIESGQYQIPYADILKKIVSVVRLK
jgi:negative regulator of flagellin synthesis FlgM